MTPVILSLLSTDVLLARHSAGVTIHAVQVPLVEFKPTFLAAYVI